MGVISQEEKERGIRRPRMQGCKSTPQVQGKEKRGGGLGGDGMRKSVSECSG